VLLIKFSMNTKKAPFDYSNGACKKLKSVMTLSTQPRLT
jgi:hypothetical protein